MKRRIVWLVVSCLMVAALVLASCAPAAVEEEEVVPPVEEEEEVVEGEVVPAVKEPQYGGTLNFIPLSPAEPTSWDPIEYSSAEESQFIGYYQEPLLAGDLSRGARGTNEYWFNDMYWVPDELIIGHLAETWEFTGPLTVVFHLRRGVYFPYKPGVMDTREMTADDVVFSWNRLIEHKEALGTRYEWMESVSAPDKYTAVLEMNKFSADLLYRISTREASIHPPEQVDAGIKDWRNAVGTGPFMLVDYVKGSSLTYERNPNYWGKTTIDGKEYQLPFVDRFSLPFIPETSTKLAALRTGKADILERCSWEFVESLEATNPELQRIKILQGGAAVVAMREDTPPFDDIRVRQAMNMAVDRQAVIGAQLGGEGVFLSWPFSKAWPESLYTPVDGYPEETQQMFQYNPEKARQLLAEAGYPDGFKAELLYCSLDPADADRCSMLASYWEDIGVEAELKPMEYGAIIGLIYGKKHKHMVELAHSNSSPISIMRNVGEPGDFYNLTIFDHADWYELFLSAKAEVDLAKRRSMLKELNAYIVSSADYVILPTGYAYCYTWPWVNNYYGESNFASRNRGLILATVWLDLDMKEEMTGRR